MIPLVHDFRGATVLVVGGGPVGARKARRFGSEAHVVVVSPEFADTEFGDAERVRAAPDPDDAGDWIARTDPALVVAATGDSDVNAAFASAARDAGALVNRADEAGEREDAGVVVPATFEDGPVTVAVSTSGESPALSKHLRERLDEEFAGAGEMADLTGALREDLKAAGVAAADRRDAVRAVVRSKAVWKALRTGGSNPRKRAEGVVSDALGDEKWST